MDKISFIKPTHKRAMEQSSNQSSDAVPASKKNCVSGPQDAPKLSPNTLYKSLFKVVPGACLFTSINEPRLEDNDPPTNPSRHHFKSSQESSIVNSEQTNTVGVEQCDAVSGEETGQCDPVSHKQTEAVNGEGIDAVTVE